MVAEEWFKRHVEGKGLRSASHTRLYLNRHILPAWAGREFTTIRRGDVTALLDTIEDTSGPVAADKVLAHINSIMRWYATRHDDYSSPIIQGMRRSNRKSGRGLVSSLTMSCAQFGKLLRLADRLAPSFGCYC